MGKGSGAEGRDKAFPDPGSAEKIRIVVAEMRRAIHPCSENKSSFCKKGAYLIGQSIAFRGMLCFFCGVCEMKEKRGKKHEEDHFYRRGYRDRNSFV